jgi:hypothetical protein
MLLKEMAGEGGPLGAGLPPDGRVILDRLIIGAKSNLEPLWRTMKTISMRSQIAKRFITVNLCVTLLYLLFASQTSAQSPRLSESQTFDLGIIRFAIPTAYLYGYFPPENSDGSGAAIAISAHLPDLQPKSADNSKDFLPASKGRNIVTPFVHYKGGLTSEESFFNAWKKEINTDVRPRRDGQFLVYVMKSDNDFLELYVNTSGQLPRYFTCMKDLGRWTNGMTLGCKIVDSINRDQLPIGPDGRYPMVVSYTIPKGYLPALIDIDARLRTLILSFEKTTH